MIGARASTYRLLAWAGGVFAAASGPAHAQPGGKDAAATESVTELSAVVVNPPEGTSVGELVIENNFGSVRVIGHDKEAIVVNAEKRAADAETVRRLSVAITPRPDGSVAIATELLAGDEVRPIAAGSIGVDLVLHVPRTARPSVDVWKGSIWVEGIDNGAAVSGNSTEIDFRHVSGEIVAKNNSGRQQYAELVGASIDAQSLDGDVALQVVQGDTLVALAHTGEVFAQDIEFRSISVRTIRGDIRMSGELFPGGVYDLASIYGDVEFTLAPRTSVVAVAYSESGHVSLPDRFRARMEAERGPWRGMFRDERSRRPAQLSLRSRLGDVRAALVDVAQP